MTAMFAFSVLRASTILSNKASNFPLFSLLDLLSPEMSEIMLAKVPLMSSNQAQILLLAASLSMLIWMNDSGNSMLTLKTFAHESVTFLIEVWTNAGVGGAWDFNLASMSETETRASLMVFF